MYELTKKKTPLWAKVIGFLFLCGIVSELLKVMFGQPTIDESLMKVSSEINKHCPIMIDSTTRLDNTGVLAGKYLAYNYTLLQRVEEVRSDTGYYKDAMKQMLINMLTTNPKLAAGRKEGIGLAATWYDSTGSYICSLVVGPEEYR